MSKNQFGICAICNNPRLHGEEMTTEHVGKWVAETVHLKCWLKYKMQFDGKCPLCHKKIDLDIQKAIVYNIKTSFGQPYFTTVHEDCARADEIAHGEIPCATCGKVVSPSFLKEGKCLGCYYKKR
jgi:hypothetical protein